MAIIPSKKLELLAQADNIEMELVRQVGDLSGLRVFGKNLLVATYIRPEKTKGGIIRPVSDIQEDVYQGNVGLLIKAGEGFAKHEQKEMFRQWVIFGYNEGMKLRFNDVDCRIIALDRIKASVTDPSKVL